MFETFSRCEVFNAKRETQSSVSRCEVEKRENRTRNFRVRELHEVPKAKALFRVFEA